MKRARTILILTAGFGNGHHAAAYGLREALKAREARMRVAVLDLLRLGYGRAFAFVARLFLGIVRHAPLVWGGIYRLFDQISRVERPMALLRKSREILRRLLEEHAVVAIVATHPAYACVWGRLRRDPRVSRVPFITVVTDAMPIHASWRHAASDAWIVPDAATAEAMIEDGLPRAKIHALGFPVSPRFAAFAARTRRPFAGPLRALWIVHGDRRRARRLFDGLRAVPDLRLTVVCGRDEPLRAELKARASGARVAVFGWVKRMPELLAAHHVAITKAGGAIIQECLAARCVPLINHIVPGQEEGNARLVARLGFGEVCSDPSAMIATVRRAATDRGASWRRWQEAVERHRRPDAARRAADLVLRAAADLPPPSIGRRAPPLKPRSFGEPARRDQKPLGILRLP